MRSQDEAAAPKIYQIDQAADSGLSEESGTLKPDWKDFAALVIAAYQVLFPVIGAFIALVLVLYLLFSLLIH